MINGKFKEHSSHPGYIEFIKEPIIPILTHFCPLCGKYNRRSQKIDEGSLIIYGYCHSCYIWWESENAMGEKSIEAKLIRFKKWLERKLKGDIQKNIIDSYFELLWVEKDWFGKRLKLYKKIR